MFKLSDTPLDRDGLIESIANHQAGALVSFEGWVRDHNQGHAVSSLEYQVYPELAQKEGERILEEARKKFNVIDVTCAHRHGHLALGDIAVWIGAVAAHRDDAFKAARFVIDEIKHRLPIWKKEHYVSAEARWVYCRDHAHHVHFEESDYYAKQAKVVAQGKLKGARVLVIGAGGLGCPASVALAAAGVGHLTIVDFDRIAISNIHRQTLFTPNLVGEKKASVAAARLRELNPFIKVDAIDAYVSPDNVERLISDHDLVLDCTDNLKTKFSLHDACFRGRKPLISASVFKAEAQLRTFSPSTASEGTGCLRCTHPVTPDDALVGNCNDFGVVAATTGTIGNLQASEALQFLQHGENATLSATLYFNLETLSVLRVKNVALSGCATCKGEVALERSSLEIDREDVSANDVILDIRELEGEALEAALRAIVSEKRIVVACHRGVRSLKAVRAMRAVGRENFVSVRGGFDENLGRSEHASTCAHAH